MDTIVRFCKRVKSRLLFIIVFQIMFLVADRDYAFSQSQNELVQIAKNDVDKNARKNAVKKLDPKLYQNELADIFLKDNDSEVCQEAFNKLYNQDLLAYIALNSDNPVKTGIVVWKITNQQLLFDIAKNAKSWTTRETAIERLDIGEQHYIAINDSLRISYALKTDSLQTLLFDIAKNDSIFTVREAARIKLKTLFENIKDQPRLMNIVLNCEYPDVRKSAMKNLTDQDILTQIAQNDADQGIRIMAIWKLTDKEILKSISRKDKDENVRDNAKWRLDQLKHQK